MSVIEGPNYLYKRFLDDAIKERFRVIRRMGFRLESDFNIREVTEKANAFDNFFEEVGWAPLVDAPPLS